MGRGPSAAATFAAGLLYPEDEASCRNAVKRLLKPYGAGSHAFCFFPHADWDVCGPELGRSFAGVRDFNADRVIVLSPVHRERGDFVHFPDFSHFETPLGALRVDTAFLHRNLPESDLLSLSNLPFEEEIGIEIALPLLKFLFPKALLLPFYWGRNSLNVIECLKKIIASAVNDQTRKTLVCISGNISGCDDKATALLNAERFKASLLLSPDEFQRSVLDDENTGCGCSGLAAAFPKNGFSNLAEMRFVPLEQVNESGKGVVYGSLCWG